MKHTVKMLRDDALKVKVIKHTIISIFFLSLGPLGFGKKEH